jgi:hypothetical protein
MNYGNPYAATTRAASQALIDSRARFIVRTYNHLFLAIFAFAAIEFGLFASGLAPVIAQALAGTSWLIVLGASCS